MATQPHPRASRRGPSPPLRRGTKTPAQRGSAVALSACGEGRTRQRPGWGAPQAPHGPLFTRFNSGRRATRGFPALPGISGLAGDGLEGGHRQTPLGQVRLLRHLVLGARNRGRAGRARRRPAGATPCRLLPSTIPGTNSRGPPTVPQRRRFTNSPRVPWPPCIDRGTGSRPSRAKPPLTPLRRAGFPPHALWIETALPVAAHSVRPSVPALHLGAQRRQKAADLARVLHSQVAVLLADV